MDALSPAALFLRVSAIRLPVQELAQAAGKHPNTVRRLDKREGREHRATVEAIEQALTKEEQRLLRHLLERFGKPELYEQIVPPADPSSSEVRDASAEQKAAAA